MKWTVRKFINILEGKALIFSKDKAENELRVRIFQKAKVRKRKTRNDYM